MLRSRCCAVLWCAVLCYAMLCCDMPCYGMLCYSKQQASYFSIVLAYLCATDPQTNGGDDDACLFCFLDRLASR